MGSPRTPRVLPKVQDPPGLPLGHRERAPSRWRAGKPLYPSVVVSLEDTCPLPIASALLLSLAGGRVGGRACSRH